MAERRKPLDEIERLRKEIEALRQERDSSSEKPEEEKAEKGRKFTDELGDLSKRAEKLLDGVEYAATKHPLSTVAAALAIGFIFGRLTSR